ncbi:MAG: cobalamin biosynthesis protein CbiA [Desulfamplus sp.]|nr:cobalamin biosynthesis protein CbiA [Desulfamplus sp.]
MSEIELEGVVVITGNYGSGKTETAVNLALNRSEAGLDVSIADLDLVNPYFRTREARENLEKHGVKVILPHDRYMFADLPILVPAVAGAIRHPSDLVILDAGGDDAGATVLAALGDALGEARALGRVNMIQVINPFRPFTDTVEGCLKILGEIETASKLKVTGLVSNSHLMEHTSAHDIYRGYELAEAISRRTGIKIEFVTAHIGLIPKLDISRFNCPVLPIQRELAFPWNPRK